jgi:hypothetical protein
MKKKFGFCVIAGIAFSTVTAQTADTKLTTIADLDASAKVVQFKNKGTGEYIVLHSDPRGGGSLVAGTTADATGWYFYQASNASANNVELKRKGVDGFNWSNYDNADDNKAFIAWNHAKRIPNATSPNAPHDWFIEEAGNGLFKIKWATNNEYLEFVPGLNLYRTTKTKAFSRPFKSGNPNQLWEIYADKVKAISPKVSGSNPNGNWEFGYGTVGGDFNRCTVNNVSHGTVNQSKKNNDWQGVYYNEGAKDVPMSAGLVFKPGQLVMHPGNGNDHLVKIKFIALEDGNYSVKVKWTAIDQQAKEIWTWIYTNATSQTGTVYDFTPKGYKELFGKGMVGHNQSTTFNKSIALKKGEVITFEVGKGNDGYANDSVLSEIEVQKK